MADSTQKKRKRGLDLEELAAIFAEEPEPRDIYAAWARLKTIVDRENAKKPLANRLQRLAPSSLGFDEALGLFGLQKAPIFMFDNETGIKIPDYLLRNIDRVRAVTNTGRGANEAFSRTVLDQILITAIYEEGIERRPRTESPQISHKHPDSKDEESVPIEEPARLELLHETPLSRTVIHRGEEKNLAGFADYSLYYDDSRTHTTATNLLIVEAKRQNSTDKALSQLASYMGIVHAARKDEGKQNHIVFGLASDGESFRFCRIDNDGNFSRSRLMEWDHVPDRDKIYGVFRSIIRAAALSSPSTTPIKDPTQRQVVLAAFGSPGRASQFDFGMGGLHVYDLEETGDGGYEIIDEEEEGEDE